MGLSTIFKSFFGPPLGSFKLVPLDRCLDDFDEGPLPDIIFRDDFGGTVTDQAKPPVRGVKKVIQFVKKWFAKIKGWFRKRFSKKTPIKLVKKTDKVPVAPTTKVPAQTGWLQSIRDLVFIAALATGTMIANQLVTHGIPALASATRYISP